MGWAYGVVDGREVGYSVEATCDHPECSQEINRGLSFLCGNIPGDGLGCGKFFCSKHLSYLIVPDHLEHLDVDHPRQVCDACDKEWEKIFEELDEEAKWTQLFEELEAGKD